MNWHQQTKTCSFFLESFLILRKFQKTAQVSKWASNFHNKFQTRSKTNLSKSRSAEANFSLCVLCWLFREQISVPPPPGPIACHGTDDHRRLKSPHNANFVHFQWVITQRLCASEWVHIRNERISRGKRRGRPPSWFSWTLATADAAAIKMHNTDEQLCWTLCQMSPAMHTHTHPASQRNTSPHQRFFSRSHWNYFVNGRVKKKYKMIQFIRCLIFMVSCELII